MAQMDVKKVEVYSKNVKRFYFVIMVLLPNNQVFFFFTKEVTISLETWLKMENNDEALQNSRSSNR